MELATSPLNLMKNRCASTPLTISHTPSHQCRNQPHAKRKDDLTGYRTHYQVSCSIRSAKARQFNTSLCGLHTIKQICPTWYPPHGLSRWKPDHNGKFQNFFKARLEKGILSNTTPRRIPVIYKTYHSFWKLWLQSVLFWFNRLYFSAKDNNNYGWHRSSNLPYNWHPRQHWRPHPSRPLLSYIAESAGAVKYIDCTLQRGNTSQRVSGIWR